jgi:hypothetical protein
VQHDAQLLQCMEAWTTLRLHGAGGVETEAKMSANMAGGVQVRPNQQRMWRAQCVWISVEFFRMLKCAGGIGPCCCARGHACMNACVARPFVDA